MEELKTMFQSLIGRLKTYAGKGTRIIPAKFQSLIGRLDYRGKRPPITPLEKQKT